MKGVLIVDDDDDILYIFKRFFDFQGYEAKTANNPESAIEIQTEQVFDYAILDYMLPKMTGEKLAEILLEKNPQVNIIFVTGYSSKYELLKNVSDNVIDVLIKPVNFDKVIDIIKGHETIQGSC